VCMNLVRLGLIALLLQPLTAHAEERPQVERTELWLSLSATLILGGVAGSYALKAAALEDRIALLLPGEPEIFDRQEDALQARRWSWGFGAGASLMALTTLLVLLHQPASGDKQRDDAPVVNPVLSTKELGVEYRATF
jgi:hypothetical protein